jgi:hypothetical protein
MGPRHPFRPSPSGASKKGQFAPASSPGSMNWWGPAVHPVPFQAERVIIDDCHPRQVPTGRIGHRRYPERLAVERLLQEKYEVESHSALHHLLVRRCLRSLSNSLSTPW